MACPRCRVFKGTPACGACLSGARILGILQSGGLPVCEERRVTGLLRGVAGELADLVESRPAGEETRRGTSPPKGGISGLTPGPNAGVAVKAEEPGSEGSFEEEGEEEEPTCPDQAVEASGEEVDKKDKEPPKEGAVSKDKSKAAEDLEKEPKHKEEQKRTLNPKFNPRYLTQRLELYPTGKASAKPEKSRGSAVAPPTRTSGEGERSRREEPDRRSRDRRGHSPARGERDDEGHRRGERQSRVRHGSERPASPDRPPLPRRPQEAPKRRKKKDKKKKNKGQKRRNRGREFKEWTEDRKRRRGQWH